MIYCGERDLAFTKQLVGNLAMQGFLVRLDGQEEVDPLLIEQARNGCSV
jgi:hypothetical protein